MATFTLIKDDMKTCPYNPLHKVAARRLQQHIIKCSKNPSNPVLVDCPFNALHKIPPKELQQHILSCKDSRQVIREIAEKQNPSAPINRPVVNRTDVMLSSNDWDEEIEKNKGKTYVIPGLVEEKDTEDGKEEKPFAIKTNIQVQCLKPAERKKYYKELVENTKLKQQEQEERAKNSAKDNADEKKSQQSTGRPSHSSTSSEPVWDEPEVKSEDPVADPRKPYSNPFGQRVRAGGIGRGVSPSTNRMQTNRSIGMSRQSIDSNDRNTYIKRERSDDDLRSAKRFSPDLQ